MQILKELDWEEVQFQLNRGLTKRGTKNNSLKQIDPSSHLTQTKQALRNALQGIEPSERISLVNIPIISNFLYFRG
jgi:hypothetical protein